MLDQEVLIFELLAVDRLAASAIASRKVAALTHEVLDYAVEDGALEVEVFPSFSLALLSSAEGAEVLSGFGHD